MFILPKRPLWKTLAPCPKGCFFYPAFEGKISVQEPNWRACWESIHG